MRSSGTSSTAITGKPYREVYDALNGLAKGERKTFSCDHGAAMPIVAHLREQSRQKPSSAMMASGCYGLTPTIQSVRFERTGP
jgi:hypothetical protein